MQAWWRLLRGIAPYKWSVFLSLLCAMGVGLSYASGVATMLPVMKIFISAEGLHGWAYRLAAENRLDASFMDFDSTVRQKKSAALDHADQPRAGVIILANRKGILKTPPDAETGAKIVRVSATRTDAAGKARDVSTQDWQGMVELLGTLPAGQRVDLDILPPGAAASPTTQTLALPAASWYARWLVAVAAVLPSDRTTALAEVVAFFVILCFVGSAFRYFQQYIGMSIANRVVMDVRRRAYDRMVQLPTSYFAQKGTSDLTSRMVQDTGTLTDGVATVLGKAVQEPVKAAFAAGLALYINWKLCLLIVVVVPILGLIIRKFSKKMKKASRRALENWSAMLGIIEETLVGVRVVKAYGAEGYERRRFAQVNKKLLREQIRLNHYAALSKPTIETLAVILASIPLIVAAHWVLAGLIDKEEFFTLLACFAAIMEPMRTLADVNSRMQQSNAAATRVFEVVDMEIEPNYSHSLPHLPPHRRSIEFRDIVFNYPGHTEVVLNHVSLNIRHGQSVAIVGGNGSGKTTLLSLLPRLYLPTEGQILVDGVDIAGVSLRSLRKQIGLVTQDTLLFADTVYHNIAYGYRHATREQVIDAARRAYADEFIRNMPDGYETRVGEHGVRLSGGQKQRIAIARAILHEPSILILDEAMSQIDSESEQKITLALREFTKNRTTLTIAHRFQTVVSADQICCLEAGRVVGLGTHSQLMETCPPYRKLYENQFREVA